MSNQPNSVARPLLTIGLYVAIGIGVGVALALPSAPDWRFDWGAILFGAISGLAAGIVVRSRAKTQES
ncbi:MAG TPA: hypothetical protein VFG04_12915 [Planctomycetaceae bacterium]|jgi:hypothetical protein|nr:hypothetical protein [Planctomycetaceae bacterium]